MAQRILGLDIGRAAVKGVVLETTLRTAQVVAFHSEPVTFAPEDSEQLSHVAQQSAVRHILENVGFVDQIVTALPGGRQACSTLDMPFSEQEKIEQTLPFQLDDLTPFDVDELIYDYQFIEHNKKGPSRLLVGTAPRSEVSEYLELLQEIQVDPRYLLMDGLPYFYLYGQMITPPVLGTWGVLDIGDHQTTLVVFRRVEEDTQEPVRVEMVRTAKRGIHHLKQALIKEFQFEPQEAQEWVFNYIDLKTESSNTDPRVLDAMTRAMGPLLAEWRRSLAAVQRRLSIAPAHLYVTGGGAYIHGLCEFLSQRLNIPTERLELTQVSTSEELQWPDDPHTYLKALGLALRPSRNTRYGRINLRQKEFSFKGDLQFLKERIRPILFGAVVLLCLSLTSLFTQFYVRSVEGGRLRKEASSRCQEIIGRDLPPGRCLRFMRYKILQAQGTSASALIPRISARDVFFEVYDRVAKLAKMKNFKVVVNSWRITADRFDIEGETTTFSAVGQIEQELKTFQCFKNLRKGKLQKQGDKVVFRIRAKISC